MAMTQPRIYRWLTAAITRALHPRPVRYMILDKDHNLVPVDGDTWAAHFGRQSLCVVAKTDVGRIRVQTAFYGMNQSWGIRPVRWFETLVYGVLLDRVSWRWATWAEAEAGHARIVAGIAASVSDPESIG